MLLRKQNVLFFTRTMQLGGTENVVLMLCEILKPYVNKIVVCSCGGVNVKKLNKLGIKHYTIPDIEKKSPVVILKTCRAIKKIIKKENISVIHTHHRMAAFYIALLKLYKKAVFINTCHNTFKDKIKLTRFAYNHCNLIACGEMVKKNLVEVFKLPKAQITVIHNAVKPFDGNIIPIPEFHQLKEQNKVIVGNIGRLSEQKGMIYFIKAMPDIIAAVTNVYFVIVGEGEQYRQLVELVNKLNLQNNVWFMGYRADIQNVMVQMDLIVLSSLWEGLPLTPIEAFSVGKTVVATAVDGTPEIVKDGRNGVLVEPSNPVAIARKVIELLTNLVEKERLESQAVNDYNDHYSFNSYQQNFLKYYSKI